MLIALRTSLLTASPTQPQKTKRSKSSSTRVNGKLTFAHDPLLNVMVEKSKMGEGVGTQSGETHRSILPAQKWSSTSEITHITTFFCLHLKLKSHNYLDTVNLQGSYVYAVSQNRHHFTRVLHINQNTVCTTLFINSEIPEILSLNCFSQCIPPALTLTKHM